MEGGNKHDLLCLDNAALSTSKDPGKQGGEVEVEIKEEESGQVAEEEDEKKSNADG